MVGSDLLKAWFTFLFVILVVAGWLGQLRRLLGPRANHLQGRFIYPSHTFCVKGAGRVESRAGDPQPRYGRLACVNR